MHALRVHGPIIFLVCFQGVFGAPLTPAWCALWERAFWFFPTATLKSLSCKKKIASYESTINSSSCLIGETSYDKLFRKHLRRFNNSLASASQSVRRHAQPVGRGPPTFVVQGMVYHNIGPLEADDDVGALNAQTYFVDTSEDPDAPTTVRINNQRFAGVRSAQERQMIAQILRELHADLTICNPYVRDMRSIYNMSAEEVGERTFVT